MKITHEEFKYVQQMAYNQFGIYLTDAKKSLIENRFTNIVQAKGYESFMPYFESLKKDMHGSEMSEFINRLTTNHTYFFREEKHFDFLRETLLPALFRQESHSHDLRIWSAGCSSGEEAFTLAMIIDDMLGEKKRLWDTTILATDISSKVLAKANVGLYPKESLNNINPIYRNRYFEIKGDLYQLKPALRKEVVFRKFNLTHPFQFKKTFHIIFCRNVLIYFDKASKEAVLTKFYNSLNHGGYLFIGHSETIENGNIGFKFVGPSIYMKE
ncbi:MAG: chemotaxis protein methyltransferase CheR [Clostridiales bacterium]|jgi:chemotaxis protein methyltransferase CheR|nr:chemotaxis protein methyltransferase CheR [Clostridiales bacterium]MDN5297772.1 chemotaxis protein methyltransferase CheR [Clostridiales bacterium]